MTGVLPVGTDTIYEGGLTVWFTGLPSSGKTTIGEFLLKQLTVCGHKAELIDGDLFRHTVSKELGFSRVDREENLRRIAYMAGLLAKHGVIVLVTTISPYRSIRDQFREQLPNFIEVYIEAPLAVCEKRDVKGLYLRARTGEITLFTGVDDPYEPPPDPEVVCHTDIETVEESAGKVFAYIKRIQVRGCHEA